MALAAAAPLISVIVPVYNGACSLDRSLRSVLRQTLPDFELIVVDDCSTDESLDILRSYQALDERVRVFATATNSGPGVARNVGLKNARGRYIAFLDSDDFWMRDKLAKQIRSFDNEDVILSCTATALVNPRGKILGIISGPPRIYLTDMKFANRVVLSSAMFRRRLSDVQKMSHLVNREDFAYWLSLLERNHGYISGMPDVLVGYVKMPGSITTNVCRNIVDTFRMYISEVNMSPTQAAVAVVFFSFYKVKKEILARVYWVRLPRAKRRWLQAEVREFWSHERERGKGRMVPE